MKRRKIQRAHAGTESFIRLLFALLLFLSVLRVIDLLPPKEPVAVPAMAPLTPAPPTTEERDTHLSIEDAKTAILSRGLDLRGQDPKILIYHTHTTEAYTATKAFPYVQTGSYRTADPSKSVLAVGEALAERLRVQYGFSVIHDITDHTVDLTEDRITASHNIKNFIRISCFKHIQFFQVRKGGDEILQLLIRGRGPSMRISRISTRTSPWPPR